MTREEAIKNHRTMWNWIADQIRDGRKDVTISHLKEKYLIEHGYDPDTILHECFCCEYAVQENGGYNDYGDYCDDYCESCPLVWGNENLCKPGYFCENTGWYWAKRTEENARKIANLPEKRCM